MARIQDSKKQEKKEEKRRKKRHEPDIKPVNLTGEKARKKESKK